jgi:hypothetical protein
MTYILPHDRQRAPGVKQTLCWVYMCPNEPTATTQRYATINGVRLRFNVVRVCEKHKLMTADCLRTDL